MTPSILNDRPWYQLTTHFFLGLFDFGVLSNTGSDAFRRVLIGIGAVLVCCGLVLTRMYLSKYAALSELFMDSAGYLVVRTREPYQLALVADEALVIALPMMVLAFATLLVSASLFPTELDFRVLLPLPISRRVVFVSKVLALVLFVALFIAAAHAAMIPLFLVMSNSRWSEQGLIQRLAAYGCASLYASTFAVLAIVAINGVLLMCVPRARLLVASMAFRSAMLCGLVLSIPLASRLPTIGPEVVSESRLLYLVPPIWFLGVEQLLLGNDTPYFVRLAQIATTVFVVALVVAVSSYTFLYQRFERVIFRPADASDGSGRRRTRLVRRLHIRPPTFAAISPFIRATLTRSPMHQGVFVAIAACGAGLVMNGFIGESAERLLRTANESLIAIVIWAPFALVFAMNLASRAALVLPIEPRANWIFRMTDDEATRGEQLRAAVRTVILLGVVLPLVMLFPVEWTVLGPRAIHCTSIAFLCGLVLVELHMGEWRRIPFTCSYSPGKRFVGHTILIGVVAFALFTTIGSGLVSYGIDHQRGWLLMMGILGAVVLQLRRRRLWLSRQAPLIFEEVLPNEVEPLQLSEY